MTIEKIKYKLDLVASLRYFKNFIFNHRQVQFLDVCLLFSKENYKTGIIKIVEDYVLSSFRKFQKL